MGGEAWYVVDGCEEWCNIRMKRRICIINGGHVIYAMMHNPSVNMFCRY